MGNLLDTILGGGSGNNQKEEQSLDEKLQGKAKNINQWTQALGEMFGAIGQSRQISEAGRSSMSGQRLDEDQFRLREKIELLKAAQSQKKRDRRNMLRQSLGRGV